MKLFILVVFSLLFINTNILAQKYIRYSSGLNKGVEHYLISEEDSFKVSKKDGISMYIDGELLYPRFGGSISFHEIDTIGIDKALKVLEKQLCYATWSNEIFAAYTGADDLTSQVGTNKTDWVNADQFIKSSSNSLLTTFWHTRYDMIYTVNMILESVEYTGTNTLEEINHCANARFLRAISLFELATIFGDVPVPLVGIRDKYISKNSKREVLNQAILDLEYVIDNITNTADIDGLNYTGKASKTAARAFLAKIYLQLAGWPYNETDKWNNVKVLTKEIIDGGNQTLMDDYIKNFQDPHQINKEIIFSYIKTKEAYPNNFRENRYYGYKWCNWGDLYLEHKFSNNYPNGYRKASSIVTMEDAVINDGENLTNRQIMINKFTPYVTTYEHPLVSKFSYGTISGLDNYENSWKTSNDNPLIRYAEVLLMYAEACANLREHEEAIKYLNYIKRRAYANGLIDQSDVETLPAEFWKTSDASVDYVYTNQQDLIDEIIKERSYEFIGEMGGHRWLDLIRLERVGEVNSHRYPASNDKEPTMMGDPNDRDLWWSPIPDLITVMHPNL